MDKNYYIKLRDNFTPDKIRLIFIAESPPESGKYFYDSEGNVKETLFKYMMLAVLGKIPETKIEGLNLFQEMGCILLDATYTPVNGIKLKSGRNRLIINSFCSLLDELLLLQVTKVIPMILIKANVCRLLEPKLIKNGFFVANKGLVIPFPSNGHQNKFLEKINIVLKSLPLNPRNHD